MHINLQQEIIGTLFTFPEELGTVQETLTPTEFTGEYRRVFAQMEIGNNADIVTIANETKIPSTTLMKWMEGNGSRFQLKKYCEQLQEANTRQRIVRIASDIKGMAQGSTAAQMIEFAEQALMNVAPATTNAPKMIGESLPQVFNELEDRYKNKDTVVGIPTGISGLDEAMNGYRNGKLYVIAARPGMGKTALAVNSAIACAQTTGRALFFSLEMMVSELCERAIADLGAVKYSNISSGRMQEADWSRLTGAAEQIKTLNIAVDDSPNMSLQYIKTQARRMYAKDDLKMVLVDYLTLMDIPDGPMRSVAIGAITRGLKQLAKELNIPIAILCQLSRKVEERTDKRPIMSDLRDSGEIEQDAYVVLFPYRETVYCQNCKDRISTPDHDLGKHLRLAEIGFGKHRGGPANITVECEFDGEYQRFSDRRNEWTRKK